MAVDSAVLAEGELIVSPDEAGEYLKTIFDQPTRKQVLMQLRMLQGTLERALNRPLTVRQFRQVKQIDEYGRLNLRWGPLVSIDAVLLNGLETPTNTVFDSTFALAAPLAYGAQVDVTYTAGGCGEMAEDVRGVILNGLARWQIQGLPVSTGAVQNVSVEGLNVQYRMHGVGSRAANGKGALGFTADELDSVSRLRRRVVL